MAERRRGHGWWPYVAPYGVFLLLVEVGARLPEGATAAALWVRVLVPGALVALYAWRGAYPELRGYRLGPGSAADVAVGLALLALWVTPYLLFEDLPRGDDPFDPERLGPARRSELLVLRFAGFALVTPFVEELFVRSFLLRVSDVLWEGRGDFRDVPIGRYRAASFWITTLWFTLSHVPWEWPVAAPTGAALTLWLYARRHLGAPIVAHAVTNAGLFALVVLGPGDLWFFL